MPEPTLTDEDRKHLTEVLRRLEGTPRGRQRANRCVEYAESAGLTAQVRSIMAMTGRAAELSTAPRRIALVAHNERKSHLRAWVSRHVKMLGMHRLISTGGK